jgi:hypothetical protein
MSFTFCYSSEYNSGDKIRNTEMGMAGSTYGAKKCIHSFDGETREKETTWKTQAQLGG